MFLAGPKVSDNMISVPHSTTDVSRGFISIMSFECQKSFLSLLPLGGVPLSPIIGRLPGAGHAIEN